MKIKSESLFNNVSKLKIKKKTLNVRKYRSEHVHKNVILYENGFMRAKNDENYEFFIKKVENDRWIPKDKNGCIPKTNIFAPKIK